MPDREKGLEIGERQEKVPAILDIIRIDGRWGQLVSSVIPGYEILVKFLDDKSGAYINLQDYDLTKEYRSLAVSTLLESEPELFTNQELDNIHWDASQHEKHPQLKLRVSCTTNQSSVLKSTSN